MLQARNLPGLSCQVNISDRSASISADNLAQSVHLKQQELSFFKKAEHKKGSRPRINTPYPHDYMNKHEIRVTRGDAARRCRLLPLRFKNSRLRPEFFHQGSEHGLFLTGEASQCCVNLKRHTRSKKHTQPKKHTRSKKHTQPKQTHTT